MEFVLKISGPNHCKTRVPSGGFEGGAQRDGVGDWSSGSHVNHFYEQSGSPL